MNTQRIGAYLIEQALINDEQLSFCLNVQKNNGNSRLGQVLKHYNFVAEIDIARALAQQVGWDLHIKEYLLDEASAKTVGWDLLREKCVFPLLGQGHPCFVLACTDDTALTDDIQDRMKCQVRFVLGLESEIRQALRRHHGEVTNLSALQGQETGEQLLTWFDQLIRQALLDNASDIHIEPSAKVVEIRFRVDGILRFVDSLRLCLLPRLVNIIFNKAEVTVSDFHHFHDARFSYLCLNRELDIRVSHIPCVYGSSLVLRILDKNKVAMSLTDLGYGAKHWDLIEANLLRPDGVTLIVGPTGCGKTTSLYAMLNFLKSINRKIVTIEDPVEMRLPLTTQLQVQDVRGITFGESVRAFLRHDPDIMLIGEIRDQETAQESMRASMTGHKVFATLHTTRALDALLRLNDLGVQTHYIAHCLSMIMAQRLLRKLCPQCKKACVVNVKDLKAYYRKYLSFDQQTVYEARGCEHCVGGFIGRTVVAEILTVNEAVKGMILNHQWALLEECLLVGQGYISFNGDAKRLIAEGTTSLQEVLRVLG